MRDHALAAAARHLRAGQPIPAPIAAALEARGVDLCALSERLLNN